MKLGSRKDINWKGVVTLIRGEKGQALILVLILLLVGGLIIAPLLTYMSTGLKVGQMHEARMYELYAADAGVEDALYKIINNDDSLPVVLGESWTYNLEDEINGKSVQVEILIEEDAETFLDDLLEENYSGQHGEWSVVDDVEPVEGIYTITVTYTPPPPGHENKKVKGIGAWLWGDYEYVAESASGMTDDYPNYEPLPFETQEYRGGTAFIWEWKQAGDRPLFTPGDSKTQSFEFTPPGIPRFYVSWAVTTADIGVVTTGAIFGIFKVTATATDNATGERTEIVAHTFKNNQGQVGIATWEINTE